MDAVRKSRPPPAAPKAVHAGEPISVEPTACALPAASLGAAYDLALRVSTATGGRIRVKCSSASLRVVQRPRAALAAGQACEVVVEFKPAAPGKVDEYVEIISQFSAVRIPVTGRVASPAE